MAESCASERDSGTHACTGHATVPFTRTTLSHSRDMTPPVLSPIHGIVATTLSTVVVDAMDVSGIRERDAE